MSKKHLPATIAASGDLYVQESFAALAETGPRQGERRLPPNAKIDHCHSCQAEIIWIHTDAGRAMPLSLATIQTRNGVQYLLPHFVDCPDSKAWSGRGKRS